MYRFPFFSLVSPLTIAKDPLNGYMDAFNQAKQQITNRTYNGTLVIRANRVVPIIYFTPVGNVTYGYGPLYSVAKEVANEYNKR